MRVDHVSYAAEKGGLRDTAARLSAAIGVPAVDGGVHPRFGTRNMILPLAQGRYLEVVEVLDHPASNKAPFGQAVRQRSADGGGWLGWVVAVDDIAPVEQRLGRASVPGSRHRPDGVELRWRQIGVKGLIADPQLPFLVQWEVPADLHPSVSAGSVAEGSAQGNVRALSAVNGLASGSSATAFPVTLQAMQIAGDGQRVLDWLGQPDELPSQAVRFDFVAPHGTPGLLSCTFATASGSVTV